MLDASIQQGGYLEGQYVGKEMDSSAGAVRNKHSCSEYD